MTSTITKWIATLGGFVLLIGVFVGIAAAQTQPPAVTLTFDRAVRLPGVTLPAGTYVFERARSDSNRQTVLVFRAKPRRLIATFMTNPTIRDGGSADVVFDYGERGSIPVIRAWYERERQDGYQFIYPRSELERIANPGVERATN